jgi:hypothetical protein
MTKSEITAPITTGSDAREAVTVLDTMNSASLGEALYSLTSRELKLISGEATGTLAAAIATEINAR